MRRSSIRASIEKKRETIQKREISMMKVERISSKVSIKPSTPTPNHLRSYKLSLLDQFLPPVFVPIILFYSSPISSSNTTDIDDHQLGVSSRLKKSLSETLTRFYPLAGRVKENLLVDCNDEGIEYFESRVNGNISDFMKRDQQHHLLPPYDLHSTLKIIGVNDPHLIVQVTLFDCGGIAICVCMSHKMADVTTLATFISTWASIARDAESIVLGPTFDSAILYPPREVISSPPISSEIDQHGTNEGKTAEKLVTRRLVFDGTKIATLRARYGNDSNGQKNKYFPTRVEAVIALIWKTAMAASSSSPKPSVANVSVETRRRLVPPLPEQSFGNLTTMVTVAAPPSITKSISCGEGVDLVSPLRESIRKINNDSLKVLQGDEWLVDFQELEVYWFTSWCRFPWYEVDFGWGKPNWVAFGSQPFFKNYTCLMDNKTGDGIEAWICMVEEDMAIFERDQELIDFISYVD